MDEVIDCISLYNINAWRHKGIEYDKGYNVWNI